MLWSKQFLVKHKKPLAESIVWISSIEHLLLIISGRRVKTRKLAAMGNGRNERDRKIVERWGNEKFSAQTLDIIIYAHILH